MQQIGILLTCLTIFTYNRTQDRDVFILILFVAGKHPKAILSVGSIPRVALLNVFKHLSYYQKLTNCKFNTFIEFNYKLQSYK